MSNSPISSCVRFAELMADKLASGKCLALAPDDSAFSQRIRLSSEEARQKYQSVLSLIAKGLGTAQACRQIGVEQSRFWSWATRNGISVQKIRVRQ